MPRQSKKDIAQAVPLTEFVDLVFAELSSHDNKWNAYLEGYGYFDNPDCWRNTIIPMAIRLYKLAQTDITVYWWLLRQMSEIDVCKEGKKWFGKSDVFEALSRIGLERSGFVLKNGLSEHFDELYEALKAKDLDTFMNYLPFERSAALIYSICRVLKRVEDVRNIFEDTLSYTKGDALGKLFLLFRRYYQYFGEAYEDEQRSCDGIAKNIFLALYQTQFREDKNDFCDVADWVGDLWMKSLMLAFLNDKGQIPQSICDVMKNVFLEGEDAEVFKSLEFDFKNHGPEAVANAGGWMEMGKYAIIWDSVFKKEWKKTIPPFSCKIVDGKRRRVVKGRERRDNCNTYLRSENAIPLAELVSKQLTQPGIDEGQQEPGKNSGGATEEVAVKKGMPKQSNETQSTIIPIPFPDTLDIAPATPKLFLEVLHSKLVSGRYLANDSVNDFVFILGGGENDSNGEHRTVDWKNGNRATLQAFCSAFYKMENLPPRKKPWAKLSKLFTLLGEPVPKLSVDANQVYGKDEERWQKARIQSAIDDAKKLASESTQE